MLDTVFISTGIGLLTAFAIVACGDRKDPKIFNAIIIGSTIMVGYTLYVTYL